MTLSEKLQYCKICKNKTFNPSTGILCNLTQAKPDFEEKCEQFVIDEEEAQKALQKKQQIEQKEDYSGFFGPEKKGIKKGVTGGIVMMVIAIVWFFGGLAANVIFYYPPILFIIGLIAFIRGIAQGNLAGEKYKNPV